MGHRGAIDEVCGLGPGGDGGGLVELAGRASTVCLPRRCFNTSKTANPSKLRPIMSAFFDCLELSPLKPQSLELMSPIIGFLRRVVSMTFPVPGMYGATSHDIASIMQPSKKKNTNYESPLLTATPFVDAMRTSPEWQELHTQYIGWIGAEAAHVPALADLHSRLKSTVFEVQEADRLCPPGETNAELTDKLEKAQGG